MGLGFRACCEYVKEFVYRCADGINALLLGDYHKSSTSVLLPTTAVSVFDSVG